MSAIVLAVFVATNVLGFSVNAKKNGVSVKKSPKSYHKVIKTRRF